MIRTSLGLAALVGVSTGALLVACGSSGARSSAGTGAASGSGASSGHGGATGSGASSGAAGGIAFEGGIGDSGFLDGDACGNVTLLQNKVPGNIVVVFDQSDSMQQQYVEADGGKAGTKWKVSEDAIVAGLTPDETLLNVGAIFFPTKATGTGCSLVDTIGTPPQIKIEPGATFIKDFQAHFAATGWSLILGTPTLLALQNANAALPDPPPMPGKRAVVLITDGAPTCDTKTADILAPVQAMFARGILTYAVGLPGSATASTLLDAIANAGGTGKYLSPSDPVALQTALAGIASDTLSQCTITLNPPPANPSLVHLVVTDSANPQGVEIPEVDAGNGWTLSADGTTATLDGTVCATAESGGYTSIQFVYGCPTVQ
jgi:hypothetical protein